jgi:hypothetical protein
MAYGKVATWDAVREMAFGTITDAFTAVGSATTKAGRAVKFTNNTDVTLYVTIDPTKSMIKMPAQTYEVWDVSTNKAFGDAPQFLEVGTKFYVKHIAGSAPGSGWVSVELLTVESGS